MTYREIPDHIRDEAVQDYLAGDTATAVAERYGIARSTLAGWVDTRGHDIGLTGGRWVPNGRGTLVWQPHRRAAIVRDLSDWERRQLAEEAMFTEAEGRRAHADYVAGSREPRAVVGERVYQRRQKREQRDRKVAA